MQVTVNDASSASQVFEQVEAVFALERENGELMLNSFATGRFVLAYFPPQESTPQLEAYHEIFSGGLFTRQEVEAVAWGINHLAMRFPGHKTPKDIKHAVIRHDAKH